MLARRTAVGCGGMFGVLGVSGGSCHAAMRLRCRERRRGDRRGKDGHE
jgi:hypothetical protein